MICCYTLLSYGLRVCNKRLYNYTLNLWGTNYDRIFKFKETVRIISLAHYKSHTSSLFKSLGIFNIKDMYNIGLLKLYF